jgi:hypothetical protein
VVLLTEKERSAEYGRLCPAAAHANVTAVVAARKVRRADKGSAPASFRAQRVGVAPRRQHQIPRLDRKRRGTLQQKVAAAAQDHVHTAHTRLSKGDAPWRVQLEAAIGHAF